jgi:hypothetical protein
MRSVGETPVQGLKEVGVLPLYRKTVILVKKARFRPALGDSTVLTRQLLSYGTIFMGFFFGISSLMRIGGSSSPAGSSGSFGLTMFRTSFLIRSTGAAGSSPVNPFPAFLVI